MCELQKRSDPHNNDFSWDVCFTSRQSTASKMNMHFCNNSASDNLFLMFSMYRINRQPIISPFSGGHEMSYVARFIQPYVVLLSKCTCIYTGMSTMHFVIPRTIQQAQRIHQNTSNGLTMEQRPPEMNSVVPHWDTKGTYRGRRQQNNQKGGGINLCAAIRE